MKLSGMTQDEGLSMTNSRRGEGFNPPLLHYDQGARYYWNDKKVRFAGRDNGRPPIFTTHHVHD